MEFGKILRAKRESRRMTQEEVAQRLGVNKQQVSHYETGYKIPPMRVVIAAAEAEVVAEHFGVKPAAKTLYTVQCGAFADKSNAEMYAEKIRRAGFAAVVVKVGKLYRVQTGAFATRGNADNYVKALKKSVFSTVIVVGK